jgi:hypothetical protein
VKLGFSFFEKWVFRLKVRRISRRRRAPHGDGLEAVFTPASRSRRSATVRAEIRCGASKFELFSHPNSDAGGGSPCRSERVGEALRVPCSAPLNPVRAAGTLGGRVRRVPSGLCPAPVVVRSDAGRCPIRRQEAPEIGDAGRALSADGADGPSRAWRLPPCPSPHGQDVTGRAPIEIGDANTVVVLPRPSERETQRVVARNPTFCR